MFMFPGTGNFSIIFIVQIFQQIYKIILRRILNVLNTEFILVLVPVKYKVAFLNSHCRLCSIINRAARNIISLCFSAVGNVNSIRQFRLIDLINLGVEDKIFSAVFLIVIISNNGVDLYITEQCNNLYISGNNHVCCYCRFRTI